MVEFSRTKEVIKHLSSVLDSLGELSNQDIKKADDIVESMRKFGIRSYFADYVVIIFYGEVEEKFYELISSQENKITGENLSKFLLRKKKKREQLIISRGIKASNLNKDFKIEERLGKEIFYKYSNIITRRHAIAHGGVDYNSGLSWDEAKQIYKVGRDVIWAIEAYLDE